MQTAERAGRVTRLGRFVAAGSVGAMLIVVLAGSVACSQQYELVPDDQVDQTERALAEKAGSAVLEAWAAGRFEPLSDDFNSEMKSALAPERAKASHKRIKGLLGEYQSMEYAETHRFKSGPKATVYRFRGTFSKASDPAEVRVVVDSGKVAGLWVMPWQKVIR